MSWLRKYSPERIDLRIIWWLITLALLVPLLVPINIPLNVSPNTQKVYNYIDKVPSGSVALISIGMNAGAWPEMDPLGRAVLRHLMTRNAKVIMVAFVIPDGGVLWELIIDEARRDGIFTGKTYGVDYVNLGFLPGGEISMATLISDFKKAVKADYRRNPVESLPMLANIRDHNDITFAITFDGTVEYILWVRQWVPVAKKPIIDMPTAAAGVEPQPYYNSGQLFGLVSGLRGGAEYETLMHKPAFASKSMDMISVGHVTFLGLMVVGNIYYFNSRRSKK